jgi:hypothetical protein
MKKFSLALLAMATALAFTPAAKADTFYFTATTTLDQVFASGYINGTLVSGSGATGTYLITSVNSGDGGVTVLDSIADPGGIANGSAVTVTTHGGSTNDEVFPNPATPFALLNGAPDGLYFTADLSGGTNPGNDLIEIFAGSTCLVGGVSTASPSGYCIFEQIGQSTDETVLAGFNITDVTPAPEPSSLMLLGTGLLGLAFVAFRKAKPARQTMNRLSLPDAMKLNL